MDHKTLNERIKSLKDPAGEFMAQANALNEVTQALDELIEGTKIVFSAPASERYKEKYLEVRPSLVQAEEIARGLSDTYLKIIKRYDIVDGPIYSKNPEIRYEQYSYKKKGIADLGISTPEDDGDFVFFWKLGQKNEEFSNWYPRAFTVEGIRYFCVEQYMMAKKALLFGDITIYLEIMKSTDPGECKDLGKFVRNFDSAVWDKCKYEIVRNGNYAKFTQHPDLMARLVATGDATLAEASPLDKNWGIGMSADDPDSRRPDRWKGENLLGKILEEIRKGAR